MTQFVTPESNLTTTTNGALAFVSTNNGNLDFFNKSGNIQYPNLIKDFDKALAENSDIALRNLLNTRDIRGGKGIRDNSRKLLVHLATKHPELILKTNLITRFIELGRWDDIFVLTTTPNYTITQLVVKTVSLELLKPNVDNLLLKWLPINSKRENDKKFLYLVRNYVKMNAKDLRKYVTSRRKVFIPEYKFCNKQWSLLDYSTIPSQCFRKSKKAFKRNDGERFDSFLNQVLNGTVVDGKQVTVKAGAIWPHEVVGHLTTLNNFSYQSNSTVIPIDSSVEAQWNSLPDFIPEGINILPIIDTSSSMLTTAYSKFTCLDLAVILGLYCSEKNKSIYKDCFLTFNSTPQFINLTDTPGLALRLNMVTKAPWGGSTNLEASFNLILQKAIEAKVPQELMPSHVLIISDGQFNSMCRGGLPIDAIKLKYLAAGYEVPKVIFWNVRTTDNVQVTMDESNTALVSGYSPAALKSVFNADFEDFSPINIMLDNLNEPKYQIEYEEKV